jgi:hypothetical protein
MDKETINEVQEVLRRVRDARYELEVVINRLNEMLEGYNEEDTNPTTYKIVRFSQDLDGENKVIKTGLTLDEAQEWCKRDDTHGDGWFDGYTEE